MIRFSLLDRQQDLPRNHHLLIRGFAHQGKSKMLLHYLRMAFECNQEDDILPMTIVTDTLQNDERFLEIMKNRSKEQLKRIQIVNSSGIEMDLWKHIGCASKLVFVDIDDAFTGNPLRPDFSAAWITDVSKWLAKPNFIMTQGIVRNSHNEHFAVNVSTIRTFINGTPEKTE